MKSRLSYGIKEKATDTKAKNYYKKSKSRDSVCT